MSIVNHPADRDSLDKILESRSSIENIQYVKDLLSAMSSIICILNDKNQVVFSNDILFEKYGLDLERDVLGFRPGEIFNCVNADNDTGGCGTSDKCQFCGANTAFLTSWKEKRQVINECRIVTHNGAHTTQLDLEITATPFSYGQADYMIVSIVDITEKKRKELLERIFFHDIINIASSLSGVLQLYPLLEEQEKAEYLEIAHSLSDQIIDEIKGQQQMLKAESGELDVNPADLQVEPFLKKICDQIRFNNAAFERKVHTSDLTGNARFRTDEMLLTRVLINMAKNALEAIDRGEKITITAKNDTGSLRFEVHNNTYIEENVQLQLFQRSYSTKGNNRGLGTYSMKLIGERYLKGKVGFTSTTENGTTFYIELPENS